MSQPTEEGHGAHDNAESWVVHVPEFLVGALAVGTLGAFTGCNTDALGDYFWGTPAGRFTLIGAVNGIALGLLLARPRRGPALTGRPARVAVARRAFAYGAAWLLSAAWAFLGAYLAVHVRLPEPAVVRIAFPLARPDSVARTSFSPHRSGEATVHLSFPSEPSGESVGQRPEQLQLRCLYLIWSVKPDEANKAEPEEWTRADGNGELVVSESGNFAIGHFDARRGQAYDVRVRLIYASAALRNEKPILTIADADRYRSQDYVVPSILSFAGTIAGLIAITCLIVAFARWRQIDRRLR